MKVCGIGNRKTNRTLKASTAVTVIYSQIINVFSTLISSRRVYEGTERSVKLIAGAYKKSPVAVLLWHGFKTGCFKSKEMKKHNISNFSIINNSRDHQFSLVRKDTSDKKNVKYIYTEKDLGEGLLEAGVPASYSVGQQLQYSNYSQ